MVMTLVAQPVTANVIPGKGVPKLWSNVISSAEAVASVSLVTLLQNTLINAVDKQWGIFTPQNKPVLTSGRVRAVDMSKVSAITNAPQENGAFSAYNKVNMPRRIMLEMLCDGSALSYGNYDAITDLLSTVASGFAVSGKKGREEFINKLEELSASTDLYVITTPEKTFTNMNVLGYNMRRGADHGLNLLRAEIMLQEVRLSGTRSKDPLNTATPWGQGAQNGGNVQASSMSDLEAAAFDAGQLY
ncbi:MAG: hypothetical protein SOH81_07970 [Acetobacter sp.]|jgi:hypothetical protein